ncbi:MAG: hypothetical protein J6S81_00465, partial [Treponema sp.]|nr:hypothetical protein [Treponema sp.]
MANLETKMQKLKLGEIDQGLAKNLGMLGIGYDQFAGMNANERMNSVFKAAGAMQDQAKAAVLVGDILGSAGREYYDWLALSGSTLSKELSEAKALNFTTEESAKGAAAFNAEFNAIVSSTKSIGLLISSKIGEALTPVAKKVKEILAANKEFIASGIIGVVDVLGKIGRGMGDVLMNLTGADSIGEALGKIAEGVKKFAGPVIEKSIELVKDLAAAIRALWVGDWNALGESIKNFCTNLSLGFANLMGVETEGKSAEDLYNDALKEGSDLANGKGGLGSVAKAMAGTNAAVTLALSGKDAKYNYKQDLYDKWQAEVPRNLIGIPEAGRALSAFSTDFIKAYLIGVQSGAISPYDNRWLDEESLKKVSSIPVNKDAPLDKLTPEAKKVFNEITTGKTAAKRTSAQTGSIRDGIIRPDGTLT